jgi:hypothetical protein
MIKKITLLIKRNKKLIIITFEIFWIIIFLLEKITSGTLAEIPQFIYVNF